MLTAGATSEVVPADQDGRTLSFRLVEDKIRIVTSIVIIAPVGKQGRTEARTFNRLQVLFRNQSIRVNIRAVNRTDDPFKCFNFFQ